MWLFSVRFHHLQSVLSHVHLIKGRELFPKSVGKKKYVWLCIYGNVRMAMHVWLCMHACMYVCMYVCMHVCMYNPKHQFYL